MRILVVDDDASSLTTAVSFLLPYGKCDDASDRESALARFRSAIDTGVPYQLVLVDIKVTGAGGETILAAFREIEDRSSLPPDQRAHILVTTEQSGRQMITDCLLSGCDDFIEKPLDKAKLIGTLHDHGVLEDKTSAASAMEKTALDGAVLADKVAKQLSTGDPELPPAMKIAMRVRQLIDCGAEIADVANLLRQDSAISTQLLKTANSAYYRGMGRSASIDQAINRLGLSRASELVMSLCCRGFLRPPIHLTKPSSTDSGGTPWPARTPPRCRF
ncbi:HDOD domain-containing protein [Desulfosarcina cetonica]|uniref:HDOD domain-containing protein n=1 Tax=Desulfosarcina cetonica TaxID=90730 RepID=UPI0006D257B1|nr:HDOD domain-containing protein [Desulfosarcina cetonica]